MESETKVRVMKFDRAGYGKPLIIQAIDDKGVDTAVNIWLDYGARQPEPGDVWTVEFDEMSLDEYQRLPAHDGSWPLPAAHSRRGPSLP